MLSSRPELLAEEGHTPPSGPLQHRVPPMLKTSLLKRVRVPVFSQSLSLSVVWGKPDTVTRAVGVNLRCMMERMNWRACQDH